MIPNDDAPKIQYGAASHLQAGLKLPWPEFEHNGRTIRVVRYCYTNKHVRDLLDCPIVREAFNRWRTKLESPAFKGTTNLAWEETNDGNRDRSKRLPRYCLATEDEWNDEVPLDTLWIDLWDESGGEGGVSSVGYAPSTPGEGGVYNHMTLTRGVSVGTVTHELGHVFGMTHEHQRHDRDDYVLYNCKNVQDYDDVIVRARVEKNLNHADAYQKLCFDEAFAREYDFGSIDFMKDIRGRVHDEPSVPFDFESVMLYSSTILARPACRGDIHACPLLKYRMTGETRLLSRIPDNEYPSDGDAKFIQKWYPNIP